MSNLEPKSMLQSIIQMKCPRCREGIMFETGAFSLKKPFEMHQRCPNCDQNYFPEPGFYYGAMFISYILTGWFCVFFMLGTHWWIGWSFDKAFLIMLAFVAVLFVWIFRISRVLWLYFNVKYKSDWAAKRRN